MHSLEWEKCKAAFEWDGSWRDIYLLSTTIEDWRKLLATLQYSYPLTFFVDGEKQSKLLPSPEELHAMRNHASPKVEVDIQGIIAVSHFFCIEEIEFDIDPRQVTDQKRLDALLDFLRCLGNCVVKDVLLTPENELQAPLIVYTHRTEEFRFVEMKP